MSTAPKPARPPTASCPLVSARPACADTGSGCVAWALAAKTLAGVVAEAVVEAEVPRTLAGAVVETEVPRTLADGVTDGVTFGVFGVFGGVTGDLPLMQPVWAGLDLPMPWLRPHSYPALWSTKGICPFGFLLSAFPTHPAQSLEGTLPLPFREGKPLRVEQYAPLGHCPLAGTRPAAGRSRGPAGTATCERPLRPAGCGQVGEADIALSLIARDLPEQT